MAYLIDCQHWSPGLSLVVLSANEALREIATFRSRGVETVRVQTIDGVAVTLFELKLLAAKQPIVLPGAVKRQTINRRPPRAA